MVEFQMTLLIIKPLLAFLFGDLHQIFFRDAGRMNVDYIQKSYDGIYGLSDNAVFPRWLIGGNAIMNKDFLAEFTNFLHGFYYHMLKSSFIGDRQAGSFHYLKKSFYHRMHCMQFNAPNRVMVTNT